MPDTQTRLRSARTLVAILLSIGAFPLVTGCGNGLATVSGEVSLDGEPLRGGDGVRAMVYLYPEGGSGAPAVGLVDESGKYSVSTGTKQGVAPGAYLVSISASELIGKEEVGVPRAGRRITPAHYADPRQSDLRVEVSPGSNTFDFALESANSRQMRSVRR